MCQGRHNTAVAAATAAPLLKSIELIDDSTTGVSPAYKMAVSYRCSKCHVMAKYVAESWERMQIQHNERQPEHSKSLFEKETHEARLLFCRAVTNKIHCKHHIIAVEYTMYNTDGITQLATSSDALPSLQN